MTAIPVWCGREHVGRHLGTLLLSNYDLPSLEEVKNIFEDKWKRELPKKTYEKLELIIALFETFERRLLHYCQLSKLSFSSTYFQADYYLPKKAAPLMFFKCLALDYPLHRGEFAYYEDQISHIILFNDVQHDRVIEFCNLISKVSIYLQNKHSALQLEKEKHCIKSCETEDKCICHSFAYDEVDA